MDGQPVVGIDTYGQVYALDTELTFVPGDLDGYLILRVRKAGKSIATLTYYVDFFPTER
jgi:hypothetical protein